MQSHDKKDSLKGTRVPTGGGRSGHNIRIPEGYFEQQCIDESEPSQACADICFIVQTSCMENAEDVMDSIKRDINTIMGKLSDQSRFTIVTYSSNANSEEGWLRKGGEIQSRKIFKSGKKCNDCQAQTHKALEICRKKIKDLQKNDIDKEKFFPKNIVIFTDGISSSTKRNPGKPRFDTIDEALRIQRKTDINIQVVKIETEKAGDEITGANEWMVLDNYPGGSGVDFINVDGLGLGVDQDVDIVLQSCGIKTDNPECCCTADVVLIVDRSNSIKKKDVNITLEFFDDFIKVQKKILEPTDIDRTYCGGLQIAVISYGLDVEIHAHLGQYDAALNELKTNGRNQSHVRKIVVIFTDGRTWKKGDRKAYEGNDTINAAQRIKDIGGEMYVTGLPNHKNISDGYEREWKFIASPPIECTIVNMQVEDALDGPFTELEYAGRHLTMEICKTGNVTCPWEKP
ncbi:unnamed protein product [Owenia fusiformis]|uniref:VWFA domain-containing protein n=1 Tax=Owenia fusiformis TaxID=6347 RepID=A0A8S4NNF8_OWEFU|nr:unnamed protein product [Owenia fusiformis]